MVKLSMLRGGKKEGAKEWTPFVNVRAELVGAEVPVWRELIVADDLSLFEVHQVLQICFQWDDAHLFGFEEGERRWGPVEAGETDCRKVTIGEVAQSAERVLYRYDFGDDWEVQLLLEPSNSGPGDLIHLVAGAGRGPLEDCGGIHAHNEIVAKVTKGTRLNKELREWLPKKYDPAAFDKKLVARALGVLERLIDSDDPDDEDFDDEDFDDEDFDEGGEDLLREFPLDVTGQPVLYDPNDRRGPDPERWGGLSFDDQVQSVRAYHSGDPMAVDVEVFELHCQLHAMVEAQVVGRAPKELGAALARLTRGGDASRHEAVHLISIGLMEAVGREEDGDERAREAFELWLAQLEPDALAQWEDRAAVAPLPDLASKKKPKKPRAAAKKKKKR